MCEYVDYSRIGSKLLLLKVGELILFIKQSTTVKISSKCGLPSGFSSQHFSISLYISGSVPSGIGIRNPESERKFKEIPKL
jgi:hypothetical protein